MPTIDTLLPDMMRVLEEANRGEGAPALKPEAQEFFDKAMADILKKGLQGSGGKRKRVPKTLYISEIGHPCHRKLWFKVRPELFTAVDINGKALFKFLYGDIIEALVLTLAIQAGHEVTHYQHPIEFEVKDGWKIRGRLDAVVDGVLIDVKSASSMSMKKFHDIDKLIGDDQFGYIMQLLTYWSNLEGVSSETGFLAVDKTDGTMVLPLLSPEGAVPSHIYEHLVDVAESSKMPDIPADLQPYQIKTLPGYKKLKPTCSYCDYRDVCWAHAYGGKGIKWVEKGGNRHATVEEC